MSCKVTCEKTTDYLEDALPWYERLAMRGHLLLCVDCRHFLAHIDRVRAVAGQLLRAQSLDQAATDELALDLHRRFY